MAKKIFLESRSEPTYYTLVGISCHHRDYRISFLLNQALEFNLVKHEDLTVPVAGSEGTSCYSFYFYRDEDLRNAYYLLSNRSDEQVLIPEMKQVDFILIVEGEFTKNRKDTVLKAIRNIPNVLMANEIKFTAIKNYENLLTELELHMISLLKIYKQKFR
jgi:hypothetical protein